MLLIFRSEVASVGLSYLLCANILCYRACCTLTETETLSCATCICMYYHILCHVWNNRFDNALKHLCCIKVLMQTAIDVNAIYLVYGDI